MRRRGETQTSNRATDFRALEMCKLCCMRSTGSRCPFRETRVVVSSKEWVQYTAQTGREFFLDIHQKQLNHIRLKLTDAKNRPIGRSTSSANQNTVTGSGNAQSTLGNLSFSAVIRFDIIKKRTVDHLETEHYKPTVPARFSNGITNQQRFGKDTFGMGPGF